LALAELKVKIQSIVDNPEMKRGNPPPIRPLRSTGLVVKRTPESVWERRLKVARNFPEKVTSTEIYNRLGLDCRKPADKKVVSRVMKAAGFVARRGRRRAAWEKVRNGGVVRQGGSGAVASLLSPLPPHHTDSVTVTPESTM
jgi:hypothetical protein